MEEEQRYWFCYYYADKLHLEYLTNYEINKICIPLESRFCGSSSKSKIEAIKSCKASIENSLNSTQAALNDVTKILEEIQKEYDTEDDYHQILVGNYVALNKETNKTHLTPTDISCLHTLYKVEKFEDGYYISRVVKDDLGPIGVRILCKAEHLWNNYHIVFISKSSEELLEGNKRY